MITLHPYTTDYAGLDPEKQLCQYVTPSGLACRLGRAKHAEVLSATTKTHACGQPHYHVDPAYCGAECFDDDDALTDIERQQFEAGIDADIDMVNSPPHYTSHASGIEAIEIKRHLSSDWSDAFKYIFRAEHKNGRQDIEKALWYAKDGVAHDLLIHAPTWRFEHQQKLQKVIDAEVDEVRKIFFTCILIGNRTGAQACIEVMLKNHE